MSNLNIKYDWISFFANLNSKTKRHRPLSTRVEQHFSMLCFPREHRGILSFRFVTNRRNKLPCNLYPEGRGRNKRNVFACVPRSTLREPLAISLTYRTTSDFHFSSHFILMLVQISISFVFWIFRAILRIFPLFYTYAIRCIVFHKLLVNA